MSAVPESDRLKTSVKEAMYIATFNVHGTRGKQRLEIGVLLRTLPLDVVCLQECSPGAADALCSMLGTSWRAVVAPAAYLANVILTRHPIREKQSLELCAGGEEPRSAAFARIHLGEWGDVGVCCTHLDYLSEEVRIAQWNLLQTQLPAEHILAGDLNALTRHDYDPTKWREITVVRARNRWEPPLHELTDKLHAAGYRDSWHHGENAGYPPTTSRFETRIDYLLLSPMFSGRFVAQSHRHIDTRATHVSDHALVMAEVVPELST